MAVQNLVMQSVIFISSDSNIDQPGIMANSLIQAFATNSLGGDLITTIDFFNNWNGSTWGSHGFLELKGFVSTTFQSTIQANIPALQSAFPTYTVVTYGNAVQFGN